MDAREDEEESELRRSDGRERGNAVLLPGVVRLRCEETKGVEGKADITVRGGKVTQFMCRE
jgi:hypothetical protein